MHRRVLPLSAVLTLSFLCGPAWSADKYAAIAFSRATGVNNVAYNHTSRSAAEDAVLGICRRQAADCTTPVWVQNGCVALAVGAGNEFGSAWGSTKTAAEQEALVACRNTAKACAIRRVACTTKE